MVRGVRSTFLSFPTLSLSARHERFLAQSHLEEREVLRLGVQGTPALQLEYLDDYTQREPAAYDDGDGFLVNG